MTYIQWVKLRHASLDGDIESINEVNESVNGIF